MDANKKMKLKGARRMVGGPMGGRKNKLGGGPSSGLKKPKPNQKGLKKLPTEVRNKMGYMAKGGRVMYSKGGSADFPPVENHAQIKGFGAVRPEVKTFGKGKK